MQPNQQFARAVTVRHLLTYTGGAGDIFGPQFAEKRLELKTLSVALVHERNCVRWALEHAGHGVVGRAQGVHSDAR